MAVLVIIVAISAIAGGIYLSNHPAMISNNAPSTSPTRSSSSPAPQYIESADSSVIAGNGSLTTITTASYYSYGYPNVGYVTYTYTASVYNVTFNATLYTYSCGPSVWTVTTVENGVTSTITYEGTASCSELAFSTVTTSSDSTTILNTTLSPPVTSTLVTGCTVVESSPGGATTSTGVCT